MKTSIHSLSNQAIASLMMALQRCILEQEDITELLRDFKLQESKDGLVVLNPPSFEIRNKEEEELEENLKKVGKFSYEV